MKKRTIHSVGTIYLGKIYEKELSISDARYFRDTFKEVLENGRIIEKDRQAIIAGATILTESQVKEVQKLFEEEYDIKFTIDLNRLEQAGITLTIWELEVLEGASKKIITPLKGIKQVKK